MWKDELSESQRSRKPAEKQGQAKVFNGLHTCPEYQIVLKLIAVENFSFSVSCCGHHPCKLHYSTHKYLTLHFQKGSAQLKVKHVQLVVKPTRLKFKNSVNNLLSLWALSEVLWRNGNHGEKTTDTNVSMTFNRPSVAVSFEKKLGPGKHHLACSFMPFMPNSRSCFASTTPQTGAERSHRHKQLPGHLWHGLTKAAIAPKNFA